MREQDTTALQRQLLHEVEHVHAFIAAWFRGDQTKNHETFKKGLGNRLAHGLVNIQPSGQILGRGDLLTPIYEAHGANPGFDISIRDLRLLHVSPENMTAAAVYVEDQTGAKNTFPADNSRITTVLFDISGPTPVWLHLHETAVR